MNAEVTEGLEQHQQHQQAGQLQQPGDLGQEDHRNGTAHQKEGQGQEHHRGLILGLLFFGIFHPGIDQGAVGLQRQRNGGHIDPGIVDRHNAIAVGAQHTGENGCREQGDALQQHSAQNIKKCNFVLFFQW